MRSTRLWVQLTLNQKGYNVNTKFTIPNVDDALNVLMRQREKALKVCQVDRGFRVIAIRSNSVDRGKMPTLGQYDL
ncbi:hypothetical protein Q3G72_025461 [Acer saccharum]|nr:hypothetical protein Q3G72_025461 [Acer saccharum]